MTSDTPPAEHARLAVVTVSYASAGVLPAFLDSAVAAVPEGTPIVIADNRPEDDDGVAGIARSYSASYVPVPGNPGYGSAVNRAVASLPPEIEWVLISNPDVVIHPGAVDALLAVALSDPSVGAVGPLIRTAEGDVYPSARMVPSIRTGVGHGILGGVWPSNPWSRRYRQGDAAVERRNAGWLSGAFVLVRRAAFEQIDGFDPGFFMYFEDVDLGYRLAHAGYVNVYEPAAAVTHTGAHSTQSRHLEMVKAHHESADRFLSKKYSGAALWPVRVVLSTGLRVRYWAASKAARR